MQPQDFVRWILPEAPFYCMGVHNGKSMQQSFYSDRDALVNAILDVDTKNPNDTTYYAFAGFSTTQRRKTYVHALKTYVFDVDVDPSSEKNGSPAYTTQQEALAALYRLVSEGKLPKPTVTVSSGMGLHLYWALDQDISREEWEPVANGIKELMRRVDPKLAADTTRAADPAGFLRLPGTTHRKTGRKVEIIDVGAYFTQDHLRSFVERSVGTLSPATKINAGGNTTAKNLLVNDDTPVSPKALTRVCPQFVDALKSQATEKYEAWYLTLQLCSFLENGRDLAHAASQFHPSYTKEETDRKYDEALHYRDEDGVGPVTCERYAMARGKPEICKSCVYAGKTKSPIANARCYGVPLLQAAEQTKTEESNQEQAQVQEKAGDANAEIVDPNELLDLLNKHANAATSFVFVDGVLCVRMHLDRTGNTGMDTVQLMPGLPKIYGMYDGSVLIGITDRSGRKIVSRRLIPADDLGSASLHHKVCAKLGIVRQADAAQPTTHFLSTLSRIANLSQSKLKLYNNFGWHDDGFVLGDQLLKGSGGSKPAYTVGGASWFKDTCKPKGTAAAAVDAFRRYMRSLTLEGKIVMLTSLASILPHIAGRYMSMLHVHGESGAGKTSLLRASMALWFGQEMMVNSTSTEKSITHMYATMQHLPVFIDEVSMLLMRNNATAIMNTLIYNTTMGKNRSTLTRAGELSGSSNLMWNNATITTANMSMASVIKDARIPSVAEALANRVVELCIDTVTIIEGQHKEALAAFDKLIANSGWIGTLFAHTVARNKGKVERKLVETAEHFQYDEKRDRFHATFLAAIEVTVDILVKMGLMEEDMTILNEIRRKLQQSITEQKADIDQSSNNKAILKDAIAEINAVAAFFVHRSVVSDDYMEVNTGTEIFRSASRKDINARVVRIGNDKYIIAVSRRYIDDRMRRVYKQDMKQTLEACKVPFQMKDVALQIGVPDANGSPILEALPVPCYVFRYDANT